MLAAIFGHVDIARLLLAAGADFRLQDNLGLTAREWAERRGSAEVAELLANPSTVEIVPPAINVDAKAETEGEFRNSVEVEKPRREAESPRLESAAEPKTAPQKDALRWFKFHKQIMAAQERRIAEEMRLASANESVIAPEQYARSGADQPQITNANSQHREVDDAATASTERPADRSTQAGSQLGVVDAIRSSIQATRNEPAPPIETKIVPQQDAQAVMDEQPEPERSQFEGAEQTEAQSAKIAIGIEALSIPEEANERMEAELRLKTQEVTPGAVESEHQAVPGGEAQGPQSSTLSEVTYPQGGYVGDNLSDTTIERPLAELSTGPAMIEPKTSERLKAPQVKRCPKCNATYENSVFMYCAYDATKLISSDVSLFTSYATNDRSRQTLWSLVAIVVVLGASLGYLINNYLNREKMLSAPPIAAKVEQPEAPRKDVPVIDGELSGMEINVPDPEYPAKAKMEGISGTVSVRVRVNKNGRVISARSSSGDWRLRTAAVEAAQNATFSPEKLAAKGRVVSGTITYTFKAQTESPVATGSPAPTNPQPVSESSSAEGSSAENVGGDYPVVGGPLVGADNNLPQPNYPERAKSKGISGTIIVTVRVNRAGKVISWRTSKGDSQLRAAALKAAKKATFSPDKLPGSGEVVGTITYNFKL